MAKHQPQLVLASRSPRRRQLFQDAGFEFEVHPAPDDVEQSFDGNDLAPADLVLELSRRKAQWVAVHYNAAVVVAADTVAECGNEILGKPTGRADAKRMLQLMSNKQHYVHTGVTLIDCGSGREVSHLETTTLMMDSIAPAQLEEYLDSGGWRDKAGAFGYQDDLDWVHVIAGLESNVVGFPMERLKTWLDELQLPG